MKIVKVIGGVGNQMFQYAFYLSLKKKYSNEIVKLDTSLFNSYKLHNGFELERIFNIKADLALPSEIKQLSWFVNNYKLQRIVRKMLPIRRTEYVEENDFAYASEVWTSQDKYYEGYWQNVNYFEDVEAEVQSAFTFKTKLVGENEVLMNKILTAELPISIHVRRGDYINHKIFGGICDLDYYKSAINYIMEKYSSPQFYLFSDDIKWCEENLLPLLTGQPLTFVDWNIGYDSFIDMQLMSCCKINIIANSSFSWWAAWLNNSANKYIIAPRIWAKTPYGQDIQLKQWHLI